MAVSDVTTQEFEEKVLKSPTPVLVDFWAEWCGPCRMFSPIIDEVSNDFTGKVNFYKLNVDENVPIAQKYSVMSIPTVILFQGGQVKAMSIGALPKDRIKKWLQENI